MAESSLVGFAHGTSGTPTASTDYFGAWGGGFVAEDFANSVTEANVQLKARGAFTAKNMRVRLQANARTTASVLTLRVNGADSALTVSVTGSTTGIFSDLSNSVSVSDGDLWNYKWTSGSGTGSQTVAGGTLEIETSGQAATQMGASLTATALTNASATRYFGFASLITLSTTEAFANLRARETATISGLQVYVATNGRSTATTVRTRKNAANGGQSVSITASTTGRFEDTSNSDSLSAGDDFCGQLVTGTGTGTITVTAAGLKYVGATAGRSMLASLSIAGASVLTTGIRYTNPFRVQVVNSSEVSQPVPLPFAGTLREFSVYISSNASTAAVTLRPRINSANVNQNVSITATTTGWFSDTSNTDAFSAADQLSYQFGQATTGGIVVRGITMLVDGPTSGGGSYTLVGDAGTFTLSGQAAGTLAQRKITGDAGAFALAGQDAGLYAGRKVTGDAGAFTLTGQAAGLLATRKLVADAAAFVLTGQDAGLYAGRRVTADAGAFALTGQDAGLRADRRLTADTGVFALTGQDATLTYTPTTAAYTLTAGTGVFTLTGQDAALTYVPLPATMGPGVRPRRARGKTWQQAFWEAEAREAFEEIEEAAELLPQRVVERAEKLIEAVEAYSGPRISITDEIVREAQARQARRNAEALIALAREAERIMAARAAEQDDEEALLLLFG